MGPGRPSFHVQEGTFDAEREQEEAHRVDSEVGLESRRVLELQLQTRRSDLPRRASAGRTTEGCREVEVTQCLHPQTVSIQNIASRRLEILSFLPGESSRETGREIPNVFNRRNTCIF